ncbi:MAG: type II toxin-antitoxin system RatA family toxin [Neisseriaceae bacterium]
MRVEKSVEVRHTAEEMYQLVRQVEEYPKFLPWCSRTVILKEAERVVQARVYVQYLMIKQHFTTENRYTENREILIRLVDGPFEYLNGRWSFAPLEADGCRINFVLDYEFSGYVLSKLFEPVFYFISNTMVDSFLEEANRRYA